jgi:hypothetical protein
MTPEKPRLTRREALEELRRHGVEGADVYLMDIIPLIEMIWADGRAQPGEIDILEVFLQQHIARLNRMSGYKVLTMAQARRFVDRFLTSRPDPELMHTLRELVAPVRLTTSDENLRSQVRDSLLAACLDIAASAVLEYPYGIDERFNTQEKRCFFEILESFEGRDADEPGEA